MWRRFKKILTVEPSREKTRNQMIQETRDRMLALKAGITWKH